MVENTTVKRRTNAKKAKEAAAVITPRLLTEEDAAIYLGVSVGEQGNLLLVFGYRRHRNRSPGTGR